MSFGWEDVVAEALALPEEVAGRAIASPGRYSDESFGLMLPLETVAMLVEAEPAHFYQTPHYVGWPAVLVRWTTPWDTVSFWLRQSWTYRAPARLRKAHSL